MKAARFYDKGDIRIEDIPEPTSQELFERLQAVQNSLQATLSASLKANLEQARQDRKSVV